MGKTDISSRTVRNLMGKTDISSRTVRNLMGKTDISPRTVRNLMGKTDVSSRTIPPMTLTTRIMRLAVLHLIFGRRISRRTAKLMTWSCRAAGCRGRCNPRCGGSRA
jgi:hypothetical protein